MPQVTTPTGRTYTGLRYCAGNCAVSLVRSGEAMEKAVQDCCRSMRIGKILVESDPDSGAAHVVFAKLPDDIASRQVRLPVLVQCTVQTPAGVAPVPDHERGRPGLHRGLYSAVYTHFPNISGLM